MILEPTHKLGNILDVLLTTCPHLVNKLSVDPRPICGRSDHSTITININKKVFKKKTKSRNLYNFKRADWNSLNLDLKRTNWKKVICYKDIHIARRDFKFVLNSTVNKHIPTITSKSKNQSPWYDIEMHHLNLKKDKLHRKAMNGTEMDRENYRQSRK